MVTRLVAVLTPVLHYISEAMDVKVNEGKSVPIRCVHIVENVRHILYLTEMGKFFAVTHGPPGLLCVDGKSVDQVMANGTDCWEVFPIKELISALTSAMAMVRQRRQKISASMDALDKTLAEAEAAAESASSAGQPPAADQASVPPQQPPRS